ncbi:Canalicular multispecific organic anion transporter [Giardia duodenalis]|uniref:Canalicular multispecific organic anion transporter n=1 Tax=Giardia intestinalis TaxID=5741 RepID=V6T8Q7_GIAIN|nr:Canalicular multispecific organic anion transporter [Giardia intestinalis]
MTWPAMLLCAFLSVLSGHPYDGQRLCGCVSIQCICSRHYRFTVLGLFIELCNCQLPQSEAVSYSARGRLLWEAPCKERLHSGSVCYMDSGQPELFVGETVPQTHTLFFQF